MKATVPTVEAFVTELERDTSLIHRKIVRVCYHFRAPDGMPFHRVTLIASARIHDDLVELEHQCGEDWGPESAETRRAQERADRAHNTIRDACERLELDLRTGRYER